MELRNTYRPSFLQDSRTSEWVDRPSTMQSRPGMWDEDLGGGLSADKPVGLVFSGGGAKGAYQAGVLKAVTDLGLAGCVRAISGTSVGAITAAAFATLRSPETIRRFWHEHIEEIPLPNFKMLSLENLLSFVWRTFGGNSFPLHGLLDRTVLCGLLDAALPSEWPADAPDVYVSALENRGHADAERVAGNFHLVRFWLNAEPDRKRRRDKILASCAMPWAFSPVRLDGRQFVDGGWDAMGGDNIPLRPILTCHPEIQTVIVVRCNSADIESGRLRAFPGVRIIEVRPSKPLPGILDDMLAALPAEMVSGRLRAWSGTFAFDSVYADAMFDIGFADAKRILSQFQ